MKAFRWLAVLLLPTAMTALAQDLSFDNRPSIGDAIAIQRTLFVCDTPAGARYMSDTGFVAFDCARLARDRVWTVVACTRQVLTHGPWWLVEVSGPDGVTAWIPLPWHDWA